MLPMQYALLIHSVHDFPGMQVNKIGVTTHSWEPSSSVEGVAMWLVRYSKEAITEGIVCPRGAPSILHKMIGLTLILGWLPPQSFYIHS